jgi:hypothetical protein
MFDKRTVFGIDFLTIMFNIKSWKNHQADDRFSQISSSVTLLYLAQWGYSRKELQEIVDTFNYLENQFSLDDNPIMINRMSKYLSDDVEGQKRLITQISSIVTLNYGLLDHRNEWADAFQLHFKLPNEVYEMQLINGIYWYERIHIIGSNYLESRLTADEVEKGIRKLKNED